MRRVSGSVSIFASGIPGPLKPNFELNRIHVGRSGIFLIVGVVSVLLVRLTISLSVGDVNQVTPRLTVL